MIDRVEGFRREFSLVDSSLQHPFTKHERVPPLLLLVIAVIIPMMILILWTLLLPPYNRQSHTYLSRFDRAWDLNLTLLGFFLSLAATITVTNAFKSAVGRPRPDIIDRCRPSADAYSDELYKLANWTICTRTSLLKDGFRSFPSGHSSISFAGLGFLSLFLAGRLAVLDQRGQVYKTVIVGAPLIAAAVVAISRLMDYRHHPFDVMFGSSLGMLIAWMAYRQFFPSISNWRSRGRPYSLLTFGEPREDREQLIASFSGDDELSNQGTPLDRIESPNYST